MKIASTNPTFRTIKNELVNSALLGLFILIVPAVITSIFRSTSDGWQMVYYWHIVAGVIVITTWFSRKHLSFDIRSLILILLFYVTGLSGYYSYGLFSFASVYFIMVILFSVILFGYRSAFFATLVCFISILGIYFAIQKGWIVYNIDFNKHHRLLSSWIATIVTFLMFSVMLTLLLGKLYVKLNEALDTIKLSEEKFRKIFENSLDGIHVSKNGIHEMMNDTFLKIFGYNNANELIGKTVTNVFAPSSHASILDYISKRQRKEQVTPNGKYKGIRKNGEIFDFEVFITNYKWNGENHVLSIIRDISEQKKFESELIRSKEKAEESDRLKSAFLANMSHEIRTPMNAIIGFSEFLVKPDLSTFKKERFSKLIQRRSYDLLHIIEDILDISKIEVGQLKFNESEILLYELICDLFEFYHQKIKNLDSGSHLHLKLSFPDELKSTMILTDRYRLKQIFTNLLDNAFKFTNAGTIEFGHSHHCEKEITFFVRDTGIGIARDKHEVIFDRFRQADEIVTDKNYGGTGLGLSIVKGIISQFKGRIWLNSVPNKGTTFFFTIPLVEKNSKPGAEISVQDFKPMWKNKTILIVEDDDANTEYLKELLSESGLNLLNAFNGKDTLEIIEKNPDIDLILMDIRLPDINGLKLTKIIRKNNSQIKIIAQTAYASPVDLQDCIDAGCHNYISKPINHRELFAMIGDFLDKTPNLD